MLMITFSPMSTRPSMVAEPIWGSSTTFGSFRELGADRRFVFEDVEAGAGDVAALEHLGQGLFVHHLAARGVDQDGVARHQRQPARRQQVIGRRRVRAVDRR